MNPNIKYELQELERIISEGEAKADIRRSQLNTFDVQLQIEIQRIKLTLVHEVFSFDDERHLERYIQYHQLALIGLLDKLNNYPAGQSLHKKEFYVLIYNGLDTLLRYIERHFVKYFDQDSKVPEVYFSLARKESIESKTHFTQALADKGANQDLIEVLLLVLQDIIDSTSERGVTFRKVIYAKELRKELSQVLAHPSNTSINEELRHVMYYLNYNSMKVITYHAHYYGSLLDAAETRLEKIEKLSLELKNISQAQVKPGMRYVLDAPTLKSQLTEYIAVEMEYQERLQTLNATASPRSDNPLSGFKLKFDASVSQLAFLLKIFIETKLLSNSNLTHLLQFMVTFSSTKKSEAISYISLRSKFYEVESGTKASVRGMLASMIHYIDRS